MQATIEQPTSVLITDTVEVLLSSLSSVAHADIRVTPSSVTRATPSALVSPELRTEICVTPSSVTRATPNCSTGERAYCLSSALNAIATPSTKLLSSWKD